MKEDIVPLDVTLASNYSTSFCVVLVFNIERMTDLPLKHLLPLSPLLGKLNAKLPVCG